MKCCARPGGRDLPRRWKGADWRTPQQRVDRALTYAMMACEELVELDPGARTVSGKFLRDIATAIQGYENWRYPITRAEQRSRAKDKRRLV